MRRDPARPITSLGIRGDVCAAAKIDIEAHLRADDLPRVALLEPLVGHFVLPAFTNLLIEDAELVADPVADRRHLERGERIQKTSSQPPEAAVAEAWFLFDLSERVKVLAERLQRLTRGCVDAEVHQVVAELR